MAMNKVKNDHVAKVPWRGRVVAVQPRIRLTRSFDQRSHTYQGYALRIDGQIGDEAREFVIAVGVGAHRKHRFRIGDRLSGEGHAVADPRLETSELYRISKLTVQPSGEITVGTPPPWHGMCPELSTYRSRGHRRLAARTYQTGCASCIWGCKMAVEIIVDHWNPSQRRYRTETFCYGPLSCALYKAGPTRKVPGRRGMSYTEEDWVDEDATSHRDPDE
jgi:hypothetical protein